MFIERRKVIEDELKRKILKEKQVSSPPLSHHITDMKTITGRKTNGCNKTTRTKNTKESSHEIALTMKKFGKEMAATDTKATATATRKKVGKRIDKRDITAAEKYEGEEKYRSLQKQ